MDASVLQECTEKNFDGTMDFPETLKRLLAIGVERYYADLVQLQKVYYGSDGDAKTEPLPLTDAVAIPDHFSHDAVKDALLSTQQGWIGYPEFLRRIMAAGTSNYSVFLSGQRAMYVGRNGDFYVEPFPRSK